MNKLTIVLACILGFALETKGQLNFGALVGINTYDVNSNPLKIKDKNTLDSFALSFKEANYGFHFGGFIRMTWGKFYIEPELIFNSNKTTYNFKKYTFNNQFDSIKKESFQYLDLPLIFGLKFNILRIAVGPVMHIFINDKSELTEIGGYSSKYKTATYAWQAGIGFDLGKVSFDLRHEGNFTKYGDHIIFFGDKFSLIKPPPDLLLLYPTAFRRIII